MNSWENEISNNLKFDIENFLLLPYFCILTYINILIKSNLKKKTDFHSYISWLLHKLNANIGSSDTKFQLQECVRPH